MRMVVVLGAGEPWAIPDGVLRALAEVPGAMVVAPPGRRVPSGVVATVGDQAQRAVAGAEVIVTEDQPARLGGGLRIRLCPPSRHGGAVCIDHGLPLDEAGRAEAAALASTSVIWEDSDEMPVAWRIALAMPARGAHAEALRRHAGRNAMIALHQLSFASADEVARVLGRLRDEHPGWALHAHASISGARAVDEGILLWPVDGCGPWPLLGKMDAVFADPGPLAWDTARLGIPVRPLGLRNVDVIAPALLADVIPAGLARESAFWGATFSLLAGCRAEGRPVPPLLRASEVRHWREQSFRPPIAPARAAAARKLAKLLRNPWLFCRDSRFALLRWLAR